MTASSSLITTPIFYVNSRPHLGHAFSMLVADAHARWLNKNSPNSIKFSTGTDEHGQKVTLMGPITCIYIPTSVLTCFYLFTYVITRYKIWQAAQKNNVKVEDWCKEISDKFKNLAVKLNISNSDFIRTTDAHHIKLVQELWVQ